MPADTKAPLGPYSVEQFLQDYWQKEPLFIKSALKDFHCPITPELLAGLACDAEVESRIVREISTPPYWECLYGPFSEQRFQQLPSSHWTLLVQECNKYQGELALLLDQFNFIPNWRVDDVMVSFAPEQGSVGPHLDQYDVFLIQAMGTRRWQINSQQYSDKDFIENLDLQILKSFHPEQEWVVEPGDILYLPPGVAHFGVAMDDAITISIGFRAPSYADLLSSFTEDRIEQLQQLGNEARYQDPQLQQQRFCGEITDATINNIKQLLQQQFSQTQHLEQWFGRFVTEPKNEPLLPLEQEYNSHQFIEALQVLGKIVRSEFSRFAYTEKTDQGHLYIDGHEYPVFEQQIPMVRLICSQRIYTAAELEPYLHTDNTLKLLLFLFNQNKLYFDEDCELFDTTDPLD